VPAREANAVSEGKQAPDFVCFNAADLGEAPNMGNSLLINKRKEFVKGNMIYSIRCRQMMTITGYSNALSYSYGPMCSEEVNFIPYGVHNPPNCRGAVIGEFVGGSEGLGHLIIIANTEMRTSMAFVSLFCLSILGFLMYGIVVVAERVFTPWKKWQAQAAIGAA
jgi:hypothetical protein